MMKKILILIGIVFMSMISVFSSNINCNGDISLTNYSSDNNISISSYCYAIRFSYSNLSNNINFNIYDNGFKNIRPFLIYDNSKAIDYKNQGLNTYQFYFKNFSNVYFKYGSDFPLITNNYINRNKFIGTSTTDATIEISNSVASGQKYYISGSFNKFKNVDMYFENFGTNTNIGEYRVFLNDIQSVNVYVDTSNVGKDEKILIIKKNVGIVNIRSNLKTLKGFNNHNIKVIDYKTFLNNGIDKIYLTNTVKTKNNIINTNDIINKNMFSKENILKTINDISYPFLIYLIGLLLMLIIVTFNVKNLKVRNKNHIVYFLLFEIILMFITLIFTKSLIDLILISIITNLISVLTYFKDEIDKSSKKKIITYTIVIIILILIYKGVMKLIV